jgi:hypothetical protein
VNSTVEGRLLTINWCLVSAAAVLLVTVLANTDFVLRASDPIVIIMAGLASTLALLSFVLLWKGSARWPNVSHAANVMPMFVTTCLGLVFNCRPLLPLASNLSFLYVAFLAYAWYLVETPPQAASLAKASYHSAIMTMPSGSDLCMFIAVLAATLPSFAASHIAYFRAVRDGQ